MSWDMHYAPAATPVSGLKRWALPCHSVHTWMTLVLLHVAIKNTGQRLHRNVLFLQYFSFFFFLVEIIYKVFSYRLLAVTTCSSNRKHYSEERAARYWSILAAPALQRKFCPTLSTENIFWKFMPKSDLKILSHILMLFLEFLFGVTSVADTFRYKDKAQNHKGLLPVPCHPF